MDLMCIDNNIALGCLPENVCQADNRKAFRTDQIPEDTARADTWKLVLVSHQDQPCSRHNRGKKGMHQVDINHRHLINDDDIRVERIICVPLKMHICRGIIHISRQFQKTMDRACLTASCLCHSFRRSSGRRCQENVEAFCLKIMDHRIDGRRFSGSGTSGQDHKTAVCRLNDCRLLHLIQLDLIFFLDLSDPLFDCLTVFLACNIQLMQHARRTQFQIIILAGVHNPQRLIPFPFGRELADDRFFVDCHILQRFLHPLRFYAEKFLPSPKQHRFRQIDMAFCRRLIQHIRKTALDAEFAVHGNPDFSGNLIRRPKSHACDIFRHFIRVFL